MHHLLNIPLILLLFFQSDALQKLINILILKTEQNCDNQQNSCTGHINIRHIKDRIIDQYEGDKIHYIIQSESVDHVADASGNDAPDQPALADGVYTADFNTDSSMFHANETCDGKGVLTVKDGQMTIHVSLASTSIVNLFPGLKEDAQKDGAVLLQPTKDTVTYPDGLTEEVNGFDIPVPALDTEFDVALIGKKGVWYDHKVSVSNPVLKENDGDDAAAIALADGTYTIEVGFEGGSGKSHVLTPCTLKVENGAATATIVWSSEKYDYMLVDGQRYDVLTTEGGSTFEIPVRALDTPLTVIGDTTAMSTPHEIEYTLTFDSSTAVEAAQ